MNKPFVCTFFGHRDFNEHYRYEGILEEILVDILRSNEYVQFLVGRNGEFDRFVSSEIRNVVKNYGFKNCSHTLILPYVTAELRDNEENFLKFYDDIEISEKAYFKSAIIQRNREMTDRADLVICYVEHNKCGGAYESVKYAEKMKKKIVNLFIIRNSEV